MNFLHGKAVERRENRSLQCLIMCVSAGEGARHQREASEKTDNADTQSVVFTTSSQTSAGFSVNNTDSLKASACACLYWEVRMGLNRQDIFNQCLPQ